MTIEEQFEAAMKESIAKLSGELQVIHGFTKQDLEATKKAAFALIDGVPLDEVRRTLDGKREGLDVARRLVTEAAISRGLDADAVSNAISAQQEIVGGHTGRLIAGRVKDTIIPPDSRSR